MILQLFRRRSKANEAIVLRVYETIVAAARQKRFYAQFQAPDTPLGRYELLGLHVFMAMRRMKGGDPALSALSQEIADEFFKDVDHSLRELGIGDQGVPKRMKKLARMFYGRVGAYEAALDADDDAALAAALTRNIRPDLEYWPHAAALAHYMRACDDWLGKIPDEVLAAGGVSFMNVDELAYEPPASQTKDEAND